MNAIDTNISRRSVLAGLIARIFIASNQKSHSDNRRPSRTVS